MTETDWLAERFEADRARLRAVAYRMLGLPAEVDDAVQEAWLRLSRTDTSGVRDLSAWLTTVVARVCLDMLRSRKTRREEALVGESATAPGADPEQEAVLADSVGLALLVVLETLSPSERVAFVLHDMFDLPFDEIATIVGRSPEATRQMASRARRRVRGASADSDAGLARRREVVSAFFAASRGGDFGALLALLDPGVVLRSDATVVAMGSAAEARGPNAVAETFAGRARWARLVLVDGEPGAVWAPGGKPKVVFRFEVTEGLISKVELLADTDVLDALDLEYLDAGRS